MDLAPALNALDLWIGHSVAERGCPGLSIAVLHDQDLVWAKGYGMADLEAWIPAAPSTRYWIGSVSKLFTATAVMQLRDAGKLQLDDPVGAYLPAFTYRNAHPTGPPITVRHLLAHTAGLARDIPIEPDTEPTSLSRDDLLVRVAETTSRFAAGEDWKYSNLGYWLLAEVVVAVTGRAYADYVQREIFTPLGMHATHLGAARPVRGLATGYGLRVGTATRPRVDVVDPGPLLSNGTAASTVEDLARFAALQVRDTPAGRGIIAPATLREMHEVHWPKAGWQGSQGLGFGIRHVGGQQRVGHNGRPSGYRSSLSIALDRKLAVVVLINASDANAVHYSNRAFVLLNAVSRWSLDAGALIGEAR